jgi:mono/diheme cytochrome c family protein
LPQAAEGFAIYQQNCQVCHGADLLGVTRQLVGEPL